MLIKRVATAIVFVSIVILTVFYLPSIFFCLFIATILSIAAWEFSLLSNIKIIWMRILYVGLIWWGFVAVQFLPIMLVLWVAFFWWIIAFCLVLAYPRINKNFINNSLIRSIIGFLIFIPCLQIIIFLYELSHFYVFFLLCVIWAADTGAYFVGRKWGKHKLAALLSPKKSVEGLIGGIIFSLLVSMFFCFLMRNAVNLWWFWLIFTTLVVLFSVLGDLFESMLKRLAVVKDSGSLLPDKRFKI